jgi:hypothetical protein
MKLLGRVAAIVGAPLLLSGLLLAGSSAFHTTKPLDDGTVASVTFRGTATEGNGNYTLTSTSCSLWLSIDTHVSDSASANVKPAKNKTIPCQLSAGGTLDGGGGESGLVTILASGAHFEFQQSGSEGCSTGNGLAFLHTNLDVPEPIYAEGSAFWCPITGSTNMFSVTGQIEIYPSGAPGGCGG